MNVYRQTFVCLRQPEYSSKAVPWMFALEETTTCTWSRDMTPLWAREGLILILQGGEEVEQETRRRGREGRTLLQEKRRTVKQEPE